MHVDLVEEQPQLTAGIIVVVIVRQVNSFLLDSPQETLGVAILPRFAYLGHADWSVSILKNRV